MFTRNPCLTDYATQLLMEKVKSSIMSKYHSTFGNLQNGRDGRERNFQKDLMVLNRNYTDTRGEAVSAIEDADLIQPFIKLRIKSIRLMAFNQSSLSAFISIQSHNS